MAEQVGCVFWEHREPGANGVWRPYGPCLGAELELAHMARELGMKTTVKYSCFGQTKNVFVEEMKEVAVDGRNAGEESPVRRVIVSGPVWFYDDGQTWIRYNPEDSVTVEAAFRRGERLVGLTLNGWRYEVEFNEGLCHQRTVLTQTITPVLRVDFTDMVGPSSFEIGVWEDVIDVQQEERDPSTRSSCVSLSDDDEDEELLVSAGKVADTDTCVLCLDEFDGEKPAMRLRDCHGHYFHRHCDQHTNVLHVLKLLGHCPVCSKSYCKDGEVDYISSPVTPSAAIGLP
mmetsp:Transcript_8430/g.25327  ORF Transcript_8430/g.25327 Transcript_8430/m.25327 type:complete len:287 (+) Transcript_8430:477-1337(+)|eukprot:CAMPEP_0198723096 /NCGR_PEP_ID=MMETSP1475-20131203/644_1 /TAXON_ID= ORGANISM="Unidentified sp., Strain CCMP1999" /NCGR_SAMPLE_ID=MMETSP1475 /ASSEMBLY_ACC=CAM_ASM_001111 /LENGTH=286 /DNA_ID=CAMNT_0044484099 /DNA_START=452 /DNA_END=1312 /DNA_ORIENTATION=+